MGVLAALLLAASVGGSSAQSAARRHADDGLAQAYTVSGCTTDQVWCGTYLRHSVSGV